ncbi:MAG: hypothetical protein A3G20_09030 [Acidobacteria bacterium RIFCSPLOWO2_12_FULL_59_11]|nr:MAG: hypothetical protein A3G20_09030 [Acidobacteria bacterium RIFCSPLOWO2_12_FULL_59_11]
MSDHELKGFPPAASEAAEEKGDWASLVERMVEIEKRLNILEDKMASTGGTVPLTPEPAGPGTSFDLERRIASPFLNYLGLLALLVGLGLLIGSWMEARPWAAIVLACLSAIALAVLGQWIKGRASENFSLTLEGTALGLVYVACYLSYVWGGIVVSLTAGALVMLLAMKRALQRNSQLVATFALLAALMGTLLLRSVRSGESLLFGYLAAVNAAALWSGRQKGWIGLRFLALLGSHVVAWFWYWSHPTAQPLLASVFPVFTFVLFAGIVPCSPLSVAEAALGVVNSVCFLAASLSLLHGYRPELVAWTPLILAGVHGVWGLYWRTSRSFAHFSELHWWLAGVLFAVGLTFPLPLVAVAIGWTAQGFFLGWIGTRRKRIVLRSAANLLGLAAAVATLLVLRPFQQDLPQSLPLLAAAAFCASILFQHRWLQQYHIQMGNWEWAAHWLLVVLATLLPMWAVSREIPLRGETMFPSLAAPLVTSVLWASYSVALCLVGWFWFSAFLRWMGVALLVMTTLKVFLVDPVALSGFSRILSFLLLSLFLLLLSYLLQSRRR